MYRGVVTVTLMTSLSLTREGVTAWVRLIKRDQISDEWLPDSTAIALVVEAALPGVRPLTAVTISSVASQPHTFLKDKEM